MPRKRTGTIERRDGKLRARVTVSTREGQTKRMWFDLDPKLSDEKARAFAAALNARLQTKTLDELQLEALAGRAATPKSTVAEFFGDVYSKELRLHRYQLSHWQHHIAPVLGHHDVRTFGPGVLRKLVEELDRKVVGGQLESTTAKVVWSVARKFCGDIVKSKKSKLRIRDDNPAANVSGPDATADRDKQWLYPDELRQFLAAESTDLELARFVAVSVYLCCRPGEAYGLTWGDIDLARGMIKISRKRDPETRVMGDTKGKDIRTFALPPLLAPMLDAMRRESTGEFLFSRYPEGTEFRAALLAAGVDRKELHETSKRNRAIRTHDCRATGISYLALAGATDDEVRERAGHRSFKTTVGYVRRGKLSGRVGEPFAALPNRLETSPGDANPGNVVALVRGKAAKRANAAAGGVPAVYSNAHGLSGLRSSVDVSRDETEAEWLSALAESSDRALVAGLLFGGSK